VHNNTVHRIIQYATLIAVFSLIPAASFAQAASTLTVAVTLSDLVPIVKTLGGSGVNILDVMPPGADPHGYTLTADALMEIQSADLVVLGNSDFLTFESELVDAIGDKQILDWPDYQRHGAEMKSFPGYDANPHGFWLGYDNAKAVAAAVAEALILNGLDIDNVTQRLAAFNSELDSLKQAGVALMEELERERSTWVAMLPGVCYTIDNLGLGVGAVVYTEGAGFASGSELMEVEHSLRQREYAGIVCPISMKDSRAGEMAEQISLDTDTPVCYVRFLDAAAEDSFLAQAAYNLGAIGATAAEGSIIRQPGIPISAHLIWAVIVFGLLITIVLQNKRMYYSGPSAASQGIFNKKKGK